MRGKKGHGGGVSSWTVFMGMAIVVASVPTIFVTYTSFYPRPRACNTTQARPRALSSLLCCPLDPAADTWPLTAACDYLEHCRRQQQPLRVLGHPSGQGLQQAHGGRPGFHLPLFLARPRPASPFPLLPPSSPTPPCIPTARTRWMSACAALHVAVTLAIGRPLSIPQRPRGTLRWDR